ncbi:serine/threonine protein kinase [Actinoallomurus sp. NBC_01490]|uniref:WD40 repeat domain-containing serine/threonine protein kinase n=1 Tax=Actinoallomurus sp. NBC_01490 TaxID=2903557 RepID=UPI002E328038|nr:serine/threonine-protein kinase [Actinoallomurus sp. NBC_01490]
MTQGNEGLIAGKYRLMDKLGEGAIGVVWRAHDTSLDRHVAIKEIRLPAGLDGAHVGSLKARTLREARAAARLSHPGIVTVHEVVNQCDRPWVVMELVHGHTLEHILKKDGPRSPRDVAEIGARILSALRAAHRAGVVHRDVKPSNVMLDGERTVLTDFGIAALDGGTVLTQTGAVLGTPCFMAPEQARGRYATPASDLWSLGATLYAAVEGRLPFGGESLAAVLAAVLTEDPPPPRRAGPLTPALSGLLVKDPARRMTADALAAELARVRDGHDVAAAVTLPPVAGPPAPRPAVRHDQSTPPYTAETTDVRRRRRRWPALTAVAAALATALTCAIIFWPSGRTQPQPHAKASPVPSVSPSVRLGGKFPSQALKPGTNVFSMAFSPDGKTFACGGSDSTIQLWDTRRRIQLAQIPGHDSIEDITFSSNGKMLATAGDDKTARLWDLTSNTQIAKFTGAKSDMWSIALSPDGRTLAGGSKDHDIRIWDVGSRQLVHVLRGHTDGVTTVKFSPDGKTLASGSWDETVRLWDTASWTQRTVLRGHTDSLHSVAFSPDGKTLASAAGDDKILLWDLRTHLGVGVFTGHKGGILSVTFSPDGRYLASGGNKDHKILLYDVAAHTTLADLKGHKGSVDSVVWSPDGKTLASGAEDKSIRLWDLDR